MNTPSPISALQYRIRAVVDMTGIPAPTLRAWERRYGIPSPRRSKSAYRLYTAEDLRLIERMRDFCAHGMAAKEAAACARGDTRDLIPTRSDDAWVKKFMRCISHYDSAGLTKLLRAFLNPKNAPTFFERVVRPTLFAVGELWREGKMSVAHEHFATDILAAELRTYIAEHQPKKGAPVLLACISEEYHVLPLYGLALHLLGLGYRCFILGARTTPQAVADAMASVKPRAVCLSATLAVSAGSAASLAEAYAKAVGTTPWALGGSGARSFEKAVVSQGGRIVLDGDGSAVRLVLTPQ